MCYCVVCTMGTMLPKLEVGISTGQALNILVNGQIKLGLMLDSVHGLPEACDGQAVKQMLQDIKTVF